MNITIRSLQGDELFNTLYKLDVYSLDPSPPLRDKDEWMGLVRGREGITCMALFEDDEAVSIAVTTPMTQNMRGKLFPVSGVWAVSTAPAVRRKGYCRQVISSLLSADRETEKVFSNLYPFRESFYERLGYVSFPLTKIAKLPTQSLAPLLKVETGGEIRLQYIGEAYDVYREYLAEMRDNRHGMTFFDYGDRAYANKNLFWVAGAVFDGVVEGIMLYRITGDEVSRYTFTTSRFYYKTIRARYLLLNWIARHVDQAEQAEIRLAEDEYPETWVSDSQVKIESAIRPGMSRVVDVEKIGGIEVGEGRFSARISDPLCPWNESVWAFEGREGVLQISRASKADCDLTIQGLSALINGAHDVEDIPFREWGNPDHTTQAIMHEMFPRMRPYMHEMF